jgi:DNA-binding transcriptional LysR family regulator
MIEHGVRDLVGRRGARLDPVVRNPVTEVLRRFALAGLGLAWLPEKLIRQDLSDGTLVPAGDASWTLDLPVYAHRLARANTPALDALWSRLARPA